MAKSCIGYHNSMLLRGSRSQCATDSPSSSDSASVDCMQRWPIFGCFIRLGCISEESCIWEKLSRKHKSLTYDDEVDDDLLTAKPVGALTRVLSRVLLVDVGDLEGLLGGPEALPRVGADALSSLGPVNHGGGVAAHRAGDAGVGTQTHHLRHVLLTRSGRSWKRGGT